MANQPESSASYPAGVYQLETTDPVQGGLGGKSNQPFVDLANRTAYLKKHVDDLELATGFQYPSIRPSLDLNFSGVGAIDSRISFARTTSATRVNEKGLIEVVPAGMPRFDYDPVTLECKGLLIEEARTNLIGNSDRPDGFIVSTSGTLTRTFGKVSGGEAFGRDETVVTFSGIGQGINASNILLQSRSVTPGTTYSESFRVRLSRPLVGSEEIRFTLTGSVGQGEILILNSTNSSSYVGKYVYVVDTRPIQTIPEFPGIIGLSNYLNFRGTFDTPVNVHVATYQVEIGRFPTSYIPTTTSQVTRAADFAAMNDITPWYRQDEGVLLVEVFSNFLPGVNNAAVSLSLNGSIAERLAIYGVPQPNGSTFYAVQNFVGGAEQVQDVAFGAAQDKSVAKISFALKNNDFAYVLNGGQVRADNSGVIGQKNRLHIGNNFGLIDFFNGQIRKIKYYPARLSNAQLQAITSV